MSQAAICIENLGKRYRLGGAHVFKQTFREAIVNLATKPIRKFRGREALAGCSKRHDDHIWAIRNINLVINEGEALGIIGHNGSGKSTLLKIISRITYPTEGVVDVTGRVGSLLEVGTGFHQELSGRENIYLSGAILGMPRKEISANIDRIIDFSGVEKFLDTPLKFYSTGMYLRLAFAVAAHMETDILLIDEVLAVGDAAFQKKCLQKMNELATLGKTVLFVSHNLPAVTHLCKKGILLDNGNIVAQGPIQEVSAEYGRTLSKTAEGVPEQNRTAAITAAGVKLLDADSGLFPETPWHIRFYLTINKPFQNVAVQLGVTSYDGNKFVLDVTDSNQTPAITKPGRYQVQVKVPALWLKPQTYALRIKVYASRDLHAMERAFSEWLNLHVESKINIDVQNEALLSPRCEWSFKSL